MFACLLPLCLLRMPLFYFKNENCTNKHKRTALFHLNHRPGFAEHHGRTKYVSGKYTYALRRTHERQSPATIYKYQGLFTLINANRSWFDSKITLDFPLKNDACLCAKRTFSRQFGVRCYNVYCPCSCTLPCPALAYSLQLTVLASVTRPNIEPIRVYPT